MKLKQEKFAVIALRFNKVQCTVLVLSFSIHIKLLHKSIYTITANVLLGKKIIEKKLDDIAGLQ